MKAAMYVKEKGRITNKEYRELSGLSDEGARIDLSELVEKGLLKTKAKGKSAHYVLEKLGD
jgi:ATP-dependent DNA helicase RecG